MKAAFAVILAFATAAAPVFANEIVVEPIDTPPPAPSARPLPPPAAKASRPDEVVVELHANLREAGLEAAGGGGERCLAPCKKAFPRGGFYRIAGDGLVPSKAFELPDGASHVTLEVQASRSALQTTGLVVVAGGLAGELFAWGYLISHYQIDAPASTTTKDVFTYGSVGGLGLMALGTVLFLAAQTRVRSLGAPLDFDAPVGAPSTP
ncbi:MAG TPA: hypothetical protein VHO06_07125 [Polyangia bacterium]|nr:hypothetical protein [Polyangia bacterium]